MEEKNKKLSLKNLPLLVVALVLIATLVGGFYLYNNKRERDTKNSIPSGWVEYKNEKYKLRFTYPKNWGEPQLSELSVDQGESYSINFSQANSQSGESGVHISATIDSDNFVKKVCAADDSSQCTNVHAFTSKDVDSRLAESKTGLLAHDENSFSTLTTEPPAQGLKLINILTTSVKMQLDSLNASAVRATYTIYGSSSECRKGNFSGSDNKGCITRDNFEELKKFLYSLSSL